MSLLSKLTDWIPIKVKKSRPYKLIVHLVIPIIILIVVISLINSALSRWPTLNRFWFGFGFLAFPAGWYGIMVAVMTAHAWGDDGE